MPRVSRAPDPRAPCLTPRAQVRGNLRAERAKEAQENPEEDARLDISSDNDSSSADGDHPVVAMSAQTRNIARQWLARVRGSGAPQRGRPAAGDISDDDSSSSEDGDGGRIEIGPKAKAVAKLWLQAVRRGGRGGRAAPQDISDDDSSSESDNSDGPRRGAPQVQLSAKTKAIALGWLRKIRQRR